MMLRNLISLDNLFARAGYVRRPPPGSYLLPAIGVFSVGIVVGGALGLLLAPSSGRELRDRIGERIRGTARSVRRAAEQKVEQAREKAREQEDRIRA